MGIDSLPKWKITTARYVVDDKWLKVRADTCLTPDGKTLDPWYVIEYPEWINCVAVDNEFNVALLRHYRHGADEYVEEIVAGTVEKDDTPMASIRRELVEEIGYQGGNVYQTGVSFANPSSQNNRVYSFLAAGGTFSKSTYKETGADFVIEKPKFTDFVQAVTRLDSSVTYQSLHLTAIFFALNYIRYSNDPGLLALRNELLAISTEP